MQNCKQFLLAAALVALCNIAVAQQPFGGCWHPDYIINWTSENDPDAKFNRATIPLQERFFDDGIKANTAQFYNGQVAACLTMNPMCSQTPSQGANNFIGYNPTYWQYIDLLIWWGGSAGEGIIIPPSAPVTDIAHLHGVKVLGQLFFPPTAFGGQATWVNQMLTKENGVFPYARKLFDIAEYYGFDGWFVNEETRMGADVQLWREWFQDYMNYAATKGIPHHELQWYNTGTVVGNYLEMMKIPGASYFLNYGSPLPTNITSQTNIMLNAGLTQEEVFKTLYFGIEQAQGGLTGNSNYFANLFPVSGHTGSIDIFNPEEPIWKQVVTNLLETPNASGTQAYAAMNTVFSNESRFWTNLAGDPSNTSGRGGSTWQGLANAIQERSTIQSKPFFTAFSAGLGKHRFVNGEKRGTKDWYHRGMQNIMPTWRWWIDVPAANKNDVRFALNWDDAYNFGTSLKVTGKLTAGVDYLTRLYKTKIAIEAGDKFQLVYKTVSSNTIQLKLATADNIGTFTTFNIIQSSTSNGWSVAEVDLSSLAGKTVSIVALNFNSAVAINSYDATLGQLAIFKGGYNPSQPSVTNLRAQNELNITGGNIRLIWDAPASTDIHHYNVYFEKNGTKSLVGQTRNEAFFIDNFERTSPDEQFVKVYVTTVTKDFKEGGEVSLQVNFPQVALSVVSLKASKTLAKVNEEITITAKADNFPSGYTWNLSASGQLVSQSGNTAVVKFTAEGIYSVGVSVTNPAGTVSFTEDRFIEINQSLELNLISVDKTIHSFSGSLPPENPEWLIDGVQVPVNVREKWCDGGKKEHWVVIDLEAAYKLYRFRVFDTGHKENAADNFKFFKIYLSSDAENWELFVDEQDRPENTKDDYIKPTIARYVKFVPYDPDKPITIRIWEFEAFGLLAPDCITVTDINDAEINMNQSMQFETTYTLCGDPSSDFMATVTSADPTIATITNVSVNQANKKISFTVNVSNKVFSSTSVQVAVYDGGWFASQDFTVSIADAAYENVALNKTATVYYYGETEEWVTENAPVVVDGNITTGKEFGDYLSAENGIYTIIDTKAQYSFSRFRVVFMSEYYPVERIEVLISGDNTTYTQAATIAGGNEDVILDKEVLLNNDVASRYLKFNFIVPDYALVTINEFEAYGKPTVSIDKNTYPETFTVLPNPVKSSDAINVVGAYIKSVKLFSMQGMAVKELPVNATDVSISTAGLPKGTYLLQIIGEREAKTFKVTIK
ncbi:MAG: discoidin domain-containing protein [Cytophagaceae bacterium]|jgi:endo-beta-N-acetylglucosaminidase D|nr:discoidin domain-containing protein [Cytophagaceae bacterium]